MKLEEMVREFPLDFLSEEEIKNLKKEKELLEKEIKLTKKEIELTRKEIELTEREKKARIKKEIKEFHPNYLCNPSCDYLTEDGDCLLGWNCGDFGDDGE